MKRIFYITVITMLLISCSSSDDVQKSCLAEPTGSINDAKTNITVMHEPNSSNNLLSSIQLFYQDESQNLILEDYNPEEYQYFTKWQILNLTTIDKIKIKFQDDTILEYDYQSTLPNNNKLVLLIQQSSIEINEYIDCNDTPSS